MPDWNPRLVSIQSSREAYAEMELIGADEEGIKIMVPKALFYTIKVRSVSQPVAQILKEEMLAKGGEAVRARSSLIAGSEKSDVLLLGTRRHYKRLIKKLKAQPFNLKALAFEIEVLLQRAEDSPAPWSIGGKQFDWGRRTYLMGVVNVTDDSFSGDGVLRNEAYLLEKLDDMSAAEVDVIDIGGESTRPGSEGVSPKEQIKRVIPAIKKAVARSGIPVSIDTTSSEVARAALEEGASIVNDISGLGFDEKMASIVAEYGAHLIVGHIKGKPRDMQEQPEYADMMSDIHGFLAGSLKDAQSKGVERSKIMIDPGIGFGKTFPQNCEILRRLKELRSLGAPIMVGTSRKAFIGHYLGGLAVDERDEGTASTVAFAASHGADLVRAHNVVLMKKVITMTDALLGRSDSEDDH